MDNEFSEKVKNEQLNSPEAKASRLKRLRNLANLTREAFCNTPELNAFTLKGWELGRRGGISKSGAQKVIERVAKEGVISSVDWLLNGTLPEPYLIPNNLSLNRDDRTGNHQNILKEIAILQTHTSNIIYTEISDDALEPYCQIGDFVAGKKLAGEQIEMALGKQCIIITASGKTYTRLFKRGSKKNLYNLMPTNLESTSTELVLTDVAIHAVAPIIRIYLNR